LIYQIELFEEKKKEDRNLPIIPPFKFENLMERNAPYPPLAEVAPRFGGDGGGFPTPWFVSPRTIRSI
jgi:hypothetical protein